MYGAILSPSRIDSLWWTSLGSSDPFGMGRRTDPFGVVVQVGKTNLPSAMSRCSDILFVQALRVCASSMQ